MATSKYNKKTRAIRRVATGAGVGGGTLRLNLNRDWLIEEHKVIVDVAQSFTGVPTSVDVRDFISTIAVESSEGRIIFLTGAQAYDLSRFTESASKTDSVLAAASTCRYAFDIHYENDGALLDLLTALRSNELTTLDLVITFAGDAANGFKGGTVPLAAAFDVSVESYDLEMLEDAPFGLQFGSFKHQADKQQVSGASTGSQPNFQLKTGNSTRFISLHAYDTSGAVAVLSDAIIGNLRLNVGTREFRVTDFASVQDHNVAQRGFDQTGVAVIDFGDDESGWLDLSSVNQALLQWDILAGSPAWRVVLGQDFTIAPV